MLASRVTNRPLPDHHRKWLDALYGEGLSLYEVGRRFGVSATSVSRARDTPAGQRYARRWLRSAEDQPMVEEGENEVAPEVDATRSSADPGPGFTPERYLELLARLFAEAERLAAEDAAREASDG